MTTQSHLQRLAPKPLRKNGLQSIEASSPLYGPTDAPTKRTRLQNAAAARKAAAQGITPHPLEKYHQARAHNRALLQQTPPTDIPIRNSTSRQHYTAPELAPSMRPGAMDAFAKPSLLWNEGTA